MAEIRQTGSFTTADAKICVKNKGSVVVTCRTAEGVEIHDMRNLTDRLKFPIKGKGILYYLGVSHLVITEAKLNAIKNSMNVID